MSAAKGLKVVGYFDCPGGGQVVVRDNVAYVGHVKPPNGTTLIDVSDPANPRKLSEITVPEGTLSHKVRVDNGIMLVNREIFPIGRQGPGVPRRPRGLRYRQALGPAPYRPHGRRVACTASRSTAATSMARRSSTAISATSSAIIDFQKPEQPEEVGRWWMPGQWTAGGETADLGGHRPSLPSSDARRQSPLRQLLARRLRHSRHRRHDQAEVHLRPRLEPAISLADAYRACRCRSCCAAAASCWWPTKMSCASPARRRRRSSGSSTSPTRPGRFRSPASRLTRRTACPKRDYTGLHQFCEEIRSTEIPIAWFARGLKVVDIANPHAPKEVASFMPPVSARRRARSEQRRLLRCARPHLSDRPRHAAFISWSGSDHFLLIRDGALMDIVIRNAGVRGHKGHGRYRHREGSHRARGTRRLAGKGRSEIDAAGSLVLPGLVQSALARRQVPARRNHAAQPVRDAAGSDRDHQRLQAQIRSRPKSPHAPSRAIEAGVKNGTTFFRLFADVGTIGGLRAARGLLLAREKFERLLRHPGRGVSAGRHRARSRRGGAAG